MTRRDRPFAGTVKETISSSPSGSNAQDATADAASVAQPLPQGS